MYHTYIKSCVDTCPAPTANTAMGAVWYRVYSAFINMPDPAPMSWYGLDGLLSKVELLQDEVVALAEVIDPCALSLHVVSLNLFV